jgi:hypothetical protein
VGAITGIIVDPATRLSVTVGAYVGNMAGRVRGIFVPKGIEPDNRGAVGRLDEKHFRHIANYRFEGIVAIREAKLERKSSLDGF